MSRAAEIDKLYQLPLDEFTAARNALAKGAGKDAAAIRALEKPPVAAWAVNQLYWRDRRAWDTLIESAEALRRVNKAVIAGRGGDVRAAGTVHDEAVHDALKATLAILSGSGHPVTDATRQSILNTLRALPADEAPGRLTRVLQPGGFEVLAGLTVGAPARKETKGTKENEAKGTKGTKQNEAKAAKGTKDEKEHTRSKADAKALVKAREAAAAADRALKDAEQAARRHEFEIARATRDEERAEKAVAQARAALDEAKAALAAAEREEKDAGARRETAQAAAKKAEAAIAAARRHAESAHAALARIVD
jgi:hypothetical protein